MPITLADFKRPPQDNGRGLHGIATLGWKGGEQGFDYWIGELHALGVKWFKVIDDNGDSLPLCQKLLAAGIFPVVRILRRDLPPNDSPEPNPGHLSAREEITIRKLVEAGVLYFETNNEPDNSAEWKQAAIPGNLEEAAKLVALNWLFDARFILEAGGYPGLPAVSSGSEMDLIGALASLGRQDILLDGCWIALHNFGQNHPLNYPGDRVHQSGVPLTQQDYDFGPLTSWVWWNLELGRPDSLEEVNQLRAVKKNAGQTIAQDHSGFREYEYADALARKYLGRSIPILTTAGGYRVGRRADLRYPRITPQLQADLTVAMFDFMQREAPDYYFAAMPWLMLPSPKTQPDAWYGDFWARTFKTGNKTNSELPPNAVPDYGLTGSLPVIGAVKVMSNLSRTAPRVPAQPMAAPFPVPAFQAAPPPPPPSEENIYLVQHGDTMASIARKFGTTAAALTQLNGLAESHRAFAGQRLVIPPPTHVTASPTPVEAMPMVAPAGNVSAPISEAYLPPPAAVAAPVAVVAPTEPGADAAMRPAPPPPPRPPSGSNAVSIDPRLAALNVHIELANVPAGQAYWKLLRAEYQDPTQAGGNHHIIYTLVDEKGKPALVQRVFQGLADIQADSFTDAFGRSRIPMWETYLPDQGQLGPYSAWVGGLPSDRVVGLGMPSGLSVNFVLTWQKTIK